MSSMAGALPTPVSRNAAQAAAHALLSLLLALALVMLVRRASGAFVQPLGGLALVAAAAGLAVLAAAVRLMLFESVSRSWYSAVSTQPPAPANRSFITPAAPTNALLFALSGLSAATILVALTLFGTPSLAIALAWFILIGSEGLSWLLAYRPELLIRDGRPLRRAAASLAEEELVAEPESDLPTGLLQQLTRIREDGRESIHAVLLAEIPPGDRQAALHVAFCPPLAEKPELTAHALDADDAQVRITQVETFGARIEVRLPAVAAETRVALIELLGAATCR